MVEKRRQKRVPLRQHVLINSSLKVMGLDLSEGGIYVHTGRHFAQGSMLDITMSPERHPVTLKGRVQHAQPNVGMGIMFMNVTPEQKQFLMNFITELSSGGTEKDQPDGRKKVLLLDDNPANLRLYKSKLVLDGYAVVEAASVEDALERIAGETVNVIVLNPLIAGGEGLNMLSLLKHHPEWKKIPALVLSPRGLPADRELCMKAGAAEFLPKMNTSPVKLSERIAANLKS